MKLVSTILDRIINELGELYGVLNLNISRLNIQENTQYCESAEIFTKP